MRDSETSSVISSFKCKVTTPRGRGLGLTQASVQEQPFKIPFVAATVLYINAEKPEMTELIISKTAEQIQRAFDQAQWRSLKLLLRFLGSLQDVLEGEGIFKILEELFDRAADLQSASAEDVGHFINTYW